MENIIERYEKLENDFERYLILDREKFLSDRYQLDATFEYYAQYFQGISDNLKIKSQDLNNIIVNLQNQNIPSLFACLCSDEKDKHGAYTNCKQFIGIFIDVLEAILECLTIENVIHSQYYSHGSQKTFQYEQFQNESKDIINQIIEELSECLAFANKNVPKNRESFERVKETDPDTFFLISNLRIVGYIMRSYFYLIMSSKILPYYLKDEENYIKSLNDSNKALAILERDFNLNAIVQETDREKIATFIEKKANKYHVYSNIAINIIKGRILYDLKNNSKALDAFCDALRLYDKLSNVLTDGGIKNYDIAISKLFAGKIFGEKGLMLDSLIWHLQALRDFSQSHDELSNKINLYVELFKQEKIKDVITKKTLISFLNEIDPNLFNIANEKEWINGYKSDLLCRIGYLTYILLWKTTNGANIKKIASWFTASLSLNKYNSLALQNLYLTFCSLDKKDSPFDFNVEDTVRNILSSDRIEASRKINFWSLFKLETQDKILPPNKDEKIKHNILRSLLTSLDNILTSPQIFNRKITLDGKLKKENTNKLLILKRWNSFTPIIPRPIDFSRHSGGTYYHGINRFPGGGYFLIWNNKGIVIDPGFDFIRNLYSAGYSIADIDAVFVTHSHIDHMNDFFSLLTLIYERKDILKIDDHLNQIKKLTFF